MTIEGDGDPGGYEVTDESRRDKSHQLIDRDRRCDKTFLHVMIRGGQMGKSPRRCHSETQSIGYLVFSAENGLIIIVRKNF
jgi:hypothetical protein